MLYIVEEINKIFIKAPVIWPGPTTFFDFIRCITYFPLHFNIERLPSIRFVFLLDIISST